MIQLTRAEIEKKLEEKYLGAVISIPMPYSYNTQSSTLAPRIDVSGKLQQLAVETIENEPMVVFSINGTQHKADVNYFIENTTIHGNTHRAGPRSQRLPEGD